MNTVYETVIVRDVESHGLDVSTAVFGTRDAAVRHLTDEFVAACRHPLEADAVAFADDIRESGEFVLDLDDDSVTFMLKTQEVRNG